LLSQDRGALGRASSICARASSPALVLGQLQTVDVQNATDRAGERRTVTMRPCPVYDFVELLAGEARHAKFVLHRRAR
jgi:hypothetical protein